MRANAAHAAGIAVAGELQREPGDAVADDGGEAEDAEMAREFSNHHLPARDRIGQQQRHGAAIHLADDRVVRQQQRDQRHQEDASGSTG